MIPNSLFSRISIYISKILHKQIYKFHKSQITSYTYLLKKNACLALSNVLYYYRYYYTSLKPQEKNKV